MQRWHSVVFRYIIYYLNYTILQNVQTSNYILSIPSSSAFRDLLIHPPPGKKNGERPKRKIHAFVLAVPRRAMMTASYRIIFKKIVMIVPLKKSMNRLPTSGTAKNAFGADP